MKDRTENKYKMKQLIKKYGMADKTKVAERTKVIMEQTTSNIYVDSLVKDNFSKQQNDFAKRLEEKRQKVALSRSDITAEMHVNADKYVSQ